MLVKTNLLGHYLSIQDLQKDIIILDIIILILLFIFIYLVLCILVLFSIIEMEECQNKNC